MFEAPTNDVFGAMWDCFELIPKKRITIKKAKAEIQRAWELWDGKKHSSTAGLLFFGWLQRYRPYFLTFRCKGDRWQTVHSWLIQTGM